MLKITSSQEFKMLVHQAIKEKRNLVPVVLTTLSDFITPLVAYKTLKNGQPSAFLESVKQGKQGRYSIIAFQPFFCFQAINGTSQSFMLKQKKQVTKSNNPISHLQEMLEAFTPLKMNSLNCFTGGAVGNFGYETVSLLEPIETNKKNSLNLPDIFLYFYDQVVVFDHVNQSLNIIVNIHLPNTLNQKTLQSLYKKGITLAQKTLTCLEKRKNISCSHKPIKKSPVSVNMSKNQFLSMVRKAKVAIKSGEVFQLVISQRFERAFSASDSLNLYRILRHTNPSPYMFHLDFGGDYVLVGASPEVMAQAEKNGSMLIRPLAGTRKRGKTSLDDKKLAKELLSDTKEVAEHLMLVDLGRNDVGKYSKIGSVEVIKLKRVEYYSHVMHIASDVEGILADNIPPFVACLGSIPAGTLSGAPKIRAMQLIAQIEPSNRGPYGGMVCWLTADRFDSCIFIRSLVLKNNKAFWQSGAGIVYNSISEKEYQETIQKAKAIKKVFTIMEGE